MTVCEKCGAELEIGQWPFCPHPKDHHFDTTHFEEYWSKHLDAKGPVRISSWRQLDREMKKRGLAHLSDFPATDAEKAHVEWSREERARRRHG